jgi:hypothetical protein
MTTFFSKMIFSRPGACAVLLSLFAFLPSQGTLFSEERSWTSSSFLDFIDGTLGDGGVNTYIASDGTIRLINLWDLNNDGNFDLPIACAQEHDEETETFVYWAGEDGFLPHRRTELPTDGAIGGAAADLNQDGNIDLVLVNRFDGNQTDLDFHIYWGSRHGFDVNRRSSLPAKAAVAVAIADLNGDAWPEIVVANQGVDYHVTVDRFQQSYIYWGSKQGYTASNRTTLKTVNCADVLVADVNQDSLPDIVFANEGNEAQESGAAIYLGNGKGDFSNDRRLDLPGLYTAGVEVDDLNLDGYADVILANMYRLKEKPDPPTSNRVDTYRVNSSIYWGGPGGFSADERVDLPTVGAHAVAAGDLNGDHFPDLVFANSAEQLSFIYWNSADGFSSTHRTQLFAMHAHDVAICDIDHDGITDLAFANYASDGFFDTNSFIYWGTQKGFTEHNRTELPTSGASAIVLDDFNSDDRTDVVFVNKIEGVSYPGGTTTAFAELGPTTSFIYWGDDEGQFDPARRTPFSTRRNTDGVLNSDLNADGYVDVLFPHFGSPSVIYWNGPDGFDPQKKSFLEAAEAATARTADFDRDGYLDLLLEDSILYGKESGFSTNDRFKFDSGGMKPSLADLNRDDWVDVIAPLQDRVVVYWNGPAGFDNQHKSELPTPGKRCIVAETADFNRDGILDVVVVSLLDYDKPLTPDDVAVLHGNPNVDGLIFYGDEEGFSQEPQPLPTIGPTDTVAADFNADGYIDLFFSSYFGGHHRNFPGSLYWNGPHGFHPDRKTEIPGFSGCGVLAADCNHDGFPELIVANHTNVGNHRSPTFVHWGSANGFHPGNRTALPATGVHFFTLCDIGNVYDRSDCYDYLSPPFDAGKPVKLTRLTWEAQTPFRTRISLQVRTAKTKSELTSAPWYGATGKDRTFETSDLAIPDSVKENRWMQYKAILASPSLVNTPVLQSVSIEYVP